MVGDCGVGRPAYLGHVHLLLVRERSCQPHAGLVEEVE